MKARFIGKGLIAIVVAGVGLAAAATPAAAQNAAQNGVLVIYGDQKCPTDSNGSEIVVCKRRNADEQFRIPKELRELKITPENESWVKNNEAVLETGGRSEEHTSELQSLMRISYAVFCLKKNKNNI